MHASARLFPAMALLLLSAPAVAQNAPVCNAGGPYQAECQGAVTAIQLDGTGSFDPNGLPLSFRWGVGCDRARVDDPASPTPILYVKSGGQCSAGCPTLLLRVTSASGTSSCLTTFGVVDTTPPVLTCPPDTNVLEGDPFDPAATGQATAQDQCGGVVAVTYSDFSFQASESQTIVQRTWVAGDGCQTSSCVQTITIAPYLLPHLDVVPGQCPNPFFVSTHAGASLASVPVSIIGNAFDPSEADLSSIRMKVGTSVDQEGPEDYIEPISAAIADTATAFEGPQCDCHTLTGDGILDLSLQFDEDEMKFLLGLVNEPIGTLVVLEVNGKLLDGTPFYAQDCVLIQ